jgi:hypothetical protein
VGAGVVLPPQRRRRPSPYSGKVLMEKVEGRAWPVTALRWQ